MHRVSASSASKTTSQGATCIGRVGCVCTLTLQNERSTFDFICEVVCKQYVSSLYMLCIDTVGLLLPNVLLWQSTLTIPSSSSFVSVSFNLSCVLVTGYLKLIGDIPSYCILKWGVRFLGGDGVLAHQRIQFHVVMGHFILCPR